MARLAESYSPIVDSLTDRYGVPSGWPEFSDRFGELLLSALAPTADVRRARALLDALRDGGLLEVTAFATAKLDDVSAILKAVGLSGDSKRVVVSQRLARWASERGTFESWEDEPTTQLRDELVNLKGVGPSMADAILLVGLRRPVFPVSRASYRILVRHGWLDPFADYDEARETIEGLARDEPTTLLRLSAWFEIVGKDHCRATTAKCEHCPLRPFLPEGGPLGDSA
jgi:endonuclease III related protein